MSKTLTETSAAAEAAALREQLGQTGAEIASAEATVERLADEVARLFACGSDAGKAEQAVTKAQAQLDVLRTRAEAQTRLLRRKEALAEEEASVEANAAGWAALKDAEERFAAARPKAVRLLSELAVTLGELYAANRAAQEAARIVGPGVGPETHDLSSWQFQEALFNEVNAATFGPDLTRPEATRVNVLVRIPKLEAAA